MTPLRPLMQASVKRGCQSVCVRGLIYKYAVNLSG